MVVPLPPDLSDVLKGLMVLIKKVLWELAHVLAVFELGGSDLRSVLEISVFVENLMDLVFDFGLQIQILEKSGDHVTYLLGLGIFVSHDLILNCLLDGPKHVRVLYLLEDKLSFLVVREVHVVVPKGRGEDNILECLIHISNSINLL